MTKNALDNVAYFALKHGGTQYHLVGFADGKPVTYDGPHDDEAGVAEARKLLTRMFARHANTRWVMVVTSEVPDLDPAINEEAADTMRDLVDRYGCGE